MTAEYTIYITSPKSYCRTDWQKTFVKKLTMALSRTVSVKVNFIVKDEDDDSYLENINKADFFFTLLDAAENGDEQYLNELYAINDNLHSSGAKAENKIFKICLNPSNNIKQPLSLKSLCGYNFFEFFGRKETIIPLEFNSREHSVKAWNLILDIAFDFNQIIEQSVMNIDDASEAKSIYLSRTSSDLMATRDEVKRELQHNGFNVLPKTDITINSQNLEADVFETIENCDFVIEILGSKYGSVKTGEKISVYEREHNAIGEAQKKLQNIHRLIWIPDFLKRKEHRQELYISRIKQKDSDFNTQVVESSFDEFKEILNQQINGTIPIPHKEAVAGELYFITPAESNIGNYNEMANAQNLRLNTIDHSNEDTLYHQHLDLLAKSDNIVILWINKDQFWLRSKLSDLVKAPGLGRKEPFKSISILANGTTPDLTNYSSWLPNINIIPYDNSDALNSFFKELTD
jgi:hypothetical protein